MDWMLYALIFMLSLLTVALLMHWLTGRRERLLRRLLDGADEFEALLHSTKEKMGAMQHVVKRVPSDIGAVADASLQAGDQIQQALRNLLEHRMWIARHGADAKLDELRTALSALERSRDAISSQLERLENAGAELIEATDAAVEQAQREPAALRREPQDT